MKFLRFKILLLLFIYHSSSAQTLPVFDFAGGFGSGTLGGNEGIKVYSDAFNNIIVTGTFVGTMDVDQGPGVFCVSSYSGSADFYVIKYNSTGALVWAKSIGGAGADKCNAISGDSNGNLFLTGTFYNAIDFDPGPSIISLSSVSLAAFILKLDSSGNFVWVKKFQGSASNSGNDIYCDVNNDFFITGYYNGSIDFDPGPGTVNYTGSTNKAYVAKFDNGGNFLAVYAAESGISEGKTLDRNSSGKVYLSGQYNGTVDFDPGPGVSQHSSINATPEIFFLSLDNNCVFEFSKSLAGYGTINKLIIDSEKNILLGGHFPATVDFDPSSNVVNLNAGSNGQDIFIAKYDSLGNYQWAFNAGNSGVASCISLASDSLGNIFATGYFNQLCDFDPSPGTAMLSSNAGSKDMFLAKYNSSGAYVWAHMIGGNMGDQGADIFVSKTNKLVFTGYFSAITDFDPSPASFTLSATVWNNPYNTFVSCYNTDGTFSFVNGPLDYFNIFDNVSKIKKDASGNIYVCGTFGGAVDFDLSPFTHFYLTASAHRDGYLAKYSPTGSFLWARQISGSENEECYDIALDNSGSCYITGYFEGTAFFNSAGTASLISNGYSDAFIAKYNSQGFLLWHKGIGGVQFDEGKTLCTDANGNVFFAGTHGDIVDLDPGPGTDMSSWIGDTDVFLVGLSTNGTYLWGGSFGGSQGDVPKCIALDTANHLILTGTFSGMADFDPGPGFVTMTGNGLADIFISKLLISGGHVWSKKIASPGHEDPHSLVIDKNNKYIIAGKFSSNLDFNPDPFVTNALIATSTNNGFMAKYDQDGVYQWVKQTTGNSVIYNIVTDTLNNIYTTGMFASNTNFGGTSINATSFDVFVGKYNSAGTLEWVSQMGGTGVDEGRAITLGDNSDIFIAGAFSTVADMDPSSGVFNINSAGGTDNFLTRLRLCQNYTTSVLSQTNVSCNGGNNGAVTLSVLPGISPTYSWIPNGNNSATQMNLTAGVHSCVVQSACGLSKTATVTITQPTPLSPQFSGQTNVCIGGTANLQAYASGGTPGYTYLWYNNSTAPQHTFVVNASTPVSFTVTDANSCTATASILVNAVPFPTITLSATAYSVCSSSNVTLTAAGGNYYNWGMGPTFTNSFVVSPQSSSVFSVTGTNSPNCSTTQSILINVWPGPSFTFQTSPPNICPNTSATIFASGAVNYTWSTGATSSSISVSPPITTYSVTGTDTQGCQATILYSPVVNPNPNINIVSSHSILCSGLTATLTANGASSYTWNTGANTPVIAISPTTNTTYTVQGESSAGCFNSITITQSVAVCTSVSFANNAPAISIYPNPSTGEFIVESNEDDCYIVVVNTLGQPVLTAQLEAEKNKLDLTIYPAGLYILNLYKKANLIKSYRLIKTN